jgi:hypothetical protein
MKYDIIKSSNYLLVVDGSEIKEGDWCYDTIEDIEEGSRIIEKAIHSMYLNERCGFKKIIAHLPLNNSPVLDGVDLLPELDDEPIGDDLDEYIKDKRTQEECVGFIDGYHQAKEKYKYTEDDLRKALSESFKASQEGYQITSDEIIQSLSQPKYPVAFETDVRYASYHDDIADFEIITTTNSQGQKVWKGEYVYE